MARFELMVGFGEFLTRVTTDLTNAKSRVLVQAMTFEGDAAGQSVAQAIQSSRAPDRRILVDDYTRHVINDRFLILNRNAVLHAEAASTTSMFERLIAGGTGVRVTNPVGRNPLSYPLRNHKKLLVIDQAAYLGGFNFSDHNSQWLDLMVRIDDASVSDWLAEGFANDWIGEPQPRRAAIGTVVLLDVTGNGNAASFAPVIAELCGAKESIELISPYATFPFVDSLAVAAHRGAEVRLYTPRFNNKPIVRDYLLAVAKRSGIALRLSPTMTHAKAALIDGEKLILGSSNFDFVSNLSNSEYVIFIRDPGLIDDFTRRVLEPLRRESAAPAKHDYSRWRGFCAKAGLHLANRAVSLLRHGPRVVEWG